MNENGRKMSPSGSLYLTHALMTSNKICSMYSTGLVYHYQKIGKQKGTLQSLGYISLSTKKDLFVLVTLCMNVLMALYKIENKMFMVFFRMRLLFFKLKLVIDPKLDE